MSNYRRVYISGGIYFFTLVTYQRQPIFSEPKNVSLLRQSFLEVKTKRSFQMLAAVVLPDHLHCLWRLPEGDYDFSTRWQMVKTAFSRRTPAHIRSNGSKTIWQPRFYEHCIRDENDLQKHLDYIHYNPVKHRLVTLAGDWPYSSFNRYVAMGYYPINWSNPVSDDMQCE